ncbi:hypothetical protein [Oecophyllibacter saccharovorans]|uniref:Uncharacterized protein n=1 Tax=Oecophyllibacter saccharovorans TaxID=2558360 RepID=A0A506UM51_9PROT|nr:hypothetical protein [Oecophyllibacter saccharovorans]TPW34408.1 hypothetical protein E3202_07945 [Oecophyllibacter saccharovorans]
MSDINGSLLTGPLAGFEAVGPQGNDILQTAREIQELKERKSAQQPSQAAPTSAAPTVTANNTQPTLPLDPNALTGAFPGHFITRAPEGRLS